MGLVLALWAIVEIPILIVAYRNIRVPGKERLDAESAIRTSLLQFMGGAVLIAGLYFTAQGFRLTREGHITGRYATAVDQMGSENGDVRIGGIYSLERIMRDSPPDREMIVEVLTSFIREHTRADRRTASRERIGADVQAALTVLARRPGGHTLDSRPLDFYHSGLNDANFRQGDFTGAWFYYSQLDSALFSDSTLDGAGLSFCHGKQAAFSHSSAKGANFVHSEFTHGWFIAADLRETDFYGCNLTGSDFGRRYGDATGPTLPPALLTNARFTNAVLTNTNLRGVDLRTVSGLTPAQLETAITDNNTLPPLKWRGEDDDKSDLA
ncbi:MAG: pentapeptide repeat-containing protein [Thermoanaerobaculia bacterium]